MSNRFIYEKCPDANGMPDRKIFLRREQNFHTYAAKFSYARSKMFHPYGWGVKNVAMLQKNVRSVNYPVRDLILVEMDVHTTSGVPLGTQHLYCVLIPFALTN